MKPLRRGALRAFLTLLALLTALTVLATPLAARTAETAETAETNPPAEVVQRQRYETAARAGNLDAQFGLGLLLEQAAARAAGENANQLLADAVFWYRAAAEQRHADAWNNLGALYYDGRGVSKDMDEAAYCYRRAAALGSAAGRYNLALLIAQQRASGSNGELVQLLKDAAEQGFANAQAQLGRLYRDGDMVGADLFEAARLFRLAAEQGHGWAQYYLGLSLLRGEGVARNIDEAYVWVSRAAERNIPPALYQQGVMLDLGLGTFADPARARELWGRALQLGVPEAALKLAGETSSDHVGQATGTSSDPTTASSGETDAIPAAEQGDASDNASTTGPDVAADERGKTDEPGDATDKPARKPFWKWRPRGDAPDVKP